MRRLIVVALFLFLFASPVFANELQDSTLVAWNAYVDAATVRFQADPFMHLTLEERSRLRSGEIEVHPWDKDFPVHVPHGLLHDWVGTMFIPKADTSDVSAVMRDYSRYPKYFASTVAKAELIKSEAGVDIFSLRMVQHVPLVTIVIDGVFQAEYTRIDSIHSYSISNSVSLQAVDNFGQPDEKVLPIDQGPGYVWRMQSYTKFEESDDGIYVEVEILGLSRDIPLILRWIVSPMVAHQPGESLKAALKKTRDTVVDHRCWLPEGCKK